MLTGRDETHLVFERHQALDALDQPEARRDIQPFPAVSSATVCEHKHGRDEVQIHTFHDR